MKVVLFVLNSTKIKDAYDNNSELQNLLLDPYFKGIVTEYQDALRDVVATGVRNGVPTPGFASVNYYDSYRSENLPANPNLKHNVTISVHIRMNVKIKKVSSILNGLKSNRISYRSKPIQWFTF